MFTVRVKERGGEERQLSFDKVEVSIGRGKANDVVLPRGNVSKRHARIVHRGDKFFVVDLRSTNGTYFNARKISSPVIVTAQDKVIIGDFVLRIEGGEADAAASMDAPPTPPPAPPEADEEITMSAPPDPEDVPPPVLGLDEEEVLGVPEPPVEPLSSDDPMTALDTHPSDGMDEPAPPADVPIAEAEEEEEEEEEEEVLPVAFLDEGPEEPPAPATSDDLIIPVELDGGPGEETPDDLPLPVETTSPELQVPPAPLDAPASDEAVAKLAWKAAELVAGDPEVAEALASGDRTALVDAYARLAMEALASHDLPETTNPREVADNLADLCLMELLLASNEVLEVTAAGHDRVFVSSGVARQAWAPGFPERRLYEAEIHRILGRLGVDTAKPPAYVEGFLSPSCRARVVLPPLAVLPICQLSAAPDSPQTLETLTWAGVVDEEQAETLRCLVESRRNVTILGGPSSGQIAMLNALSALLPTEALIAAGEHRPGLRIDKPGLLRFHLQDDALRAGEMLSRLERFRAEVLVVDEVNDRLLPGFVQAAHEASPQNLATAIGKDLDRFLRRAVAVVAKKESVGGEAAAIELVAEVFDVLVLMERNPSGGYRVARIGQVVQAKNGKLTVNEVGSR